MSVLFGNSQSVELRVDAGRLVSLGLGDQVYVGSYLGYSQYQAYVLNKLNNRELFSESRLQVGVAIGWLGPDSF